MESWRTPIWHEMPPLDGQLTITDSISNSSICPYREGVFKLYVCGITPYDAAHVGHLFTYLIYDVLVRVVKSLGVAVQYCQNITDIDDPLFERARNINKPWHEVANQQIDLFVDTMEFLRVVPPQKYQKVTESMNEILDQIKALADNSYVLGDSVYFKSDETAAIDFTNLSKEKLIELAKQRGGDPFTDGKYSELDPKIWLTSNSDEPAWESVFGSGRPGWHIECVAISNGFFNDSFDLQGGGQDLVFPHHAFCEQITKALFGRNMTNSYMHINLVSYQGHKMSKSLGNLVFASNLIDSGYTVDEIRLGLIAQPWNQDWEFEFEILNNARRILAEWKNAFSTGTFPGKDKLNSLIDLHLLNNLDVSGFVNSISLDISKNESQADVDYSEKLISNLLGIEIG